MLTPPDLWGSTGYVSQGGGPGAGADTQAMFKVGRGGVRVSGCQDKRYLLQARQGEEGESGWGEEGRETPAENIVLINRQRQVSKG